MYVRCPAWYPTQSFPFFFFLIFIFTLFYFTILYWFWSKKWLITSYLYLFSFRHPQTILWHPAVLFQSSLFQATKGQLLLWKQMLSRCVKTPTGDKENHGDYFRLVHRRLSISWSPKQSKEKRQPNDTCKSGHLALALQVKLNFSIGRTENFFKVINDLQDWFTTEEKVVRL